MYDWVVVHIENEIFSKQKFKSLPQTSNTSTHFLLFLSLDEWVGKLLIKSIHIVGYT